MKYVVHHYFGDKPKDISDHVNFMHKKGYIVKEFSSNYAQEDNLLAAILFEKEKENEAK